jgi:RimJ/RimL family protein N-acetyltransferase
LEDTHPENREAILGIAIGDRSYWDGGYGTDAMRVLCRFGFDMMNLHRIQLDVYEGNERAIHVYEKVGFQVEGRRREAMFKYGRYQDVIVMGLLSGELKME